MYKNKAELIMLLDQNIEARTGLITGPYRDPRMGPGLFSHFERAVTEMRPDHRADLLASASAPMQNFLIAQNFRPSDVWCGLNDLSVKTQSHVMIGKNDLTGAQPYFATDDDRSSMLLETVSRESAYLPIAFGNLQRIMAQVPFQNTGRATLRHTDIPLIERQIAEPIDTQNRILAHALGLDFDRAVRTQRERIEALAVTGMDYFRPLNPGLWPIPESKRD